MPTLRKLVERLLDERFPDVGMDCPWFSVAVVLFSAAILETTNVKALCEFTGFRREYVEAIESNMTNNGLWKQGQYIALAWLSGNGDIEENEFADQVEAALGVLWFCHEACDNGKTIDVAAMEPRPVRKEAATNLPPLVGQA